MVGMWDQYKNLSVEAQDIGDAIAETEQEIFDSAFDNAPDDNDFSDDLEQVEGFDGEPLSDDDMLEGPNENGYDRPASLRRDENLIEENERLRQAVADRDARFDELQNGPERQEQFRQQAREMLYQQYGILPTDDRIDGLVNVLTQQNAAMQSMQNDRVNQSMARAHNEYGHDFERAFQSFTGMDRNHPTAQALVRDVMSAPDPGERLMALNGRAIGAGTRGLELPSLNSGTPGRGYSRGSSGRGGRDLAQEYSGFGNEEVESDIFRSIWD